MDTAAVPVRLYLAAQLPRLDDTTELAVSRVAQEALTNVARRAGASRVEIQLTTVGNRILLRIVDDGKGITPTTPRAAASMT